MILLGTQIKEEIQNNNIDFTGEIENVGPNSVDVTLHKTLKTYVPYKIIDILKDGKVFKKIIEDTEAMGPDFFIRMDENNKVYSYDIPEEGLILSPNMLFLGATNEIAGSDNFVPMYEGRSSTARLGFQSHLSAGFGDISFKSNWTLEIIVIQPLLIFKNARVGQVYFHEVDAIHKEKLFDEGLAYSQGTTHKYSNQPTAQASKMYLDFEKSDAV